MSNLSISPNLDHPKPNLLYCLLIASFDKICQPLNFSHFNLSSFAVGCYTIYTVWWVILKAKNYCSQKFHEFLFSHFSEASMGLVLYSIVVMVCIACHLVYTSDMNILCLLLLLRQCVMMWVGYVVCLVCCSLPMFVVLRRFTLLFTMIGEQYYLGLVSVFLSVCLSSVFC